MISGSVGATQPCASSHSSLPCQTVLDGQGTERLGDEQQRGRVLRGHGARAAAQQGQGRGEVRRVEDRLLRDETAEGVPEQVDRPGCDALDERDGVLGEGGQGVRLRRTGALVLAPLVVGHHPPAVRPPAAGGR